MKLYTVTVESELVVLANSKLEAEKIAEDSYKKDDGDLAVDADEIRSVYSIHEYWWDSYPWGDDNCTKTVKQWVKELSKQYVCPEHGHVPEGETYESENGDLGHKNCWKKVVIEQW